MFPSSWLITVCAGVLLLAAAGWRVAHRRQMRAWVAAALADPDPHRRRAAVLVATEQGLRANAALLAGHLERERDPAVLAALADGVLRNSWEPSDQPAILRLRMWVHEQQPSPAADVDGSATGPAARAERERMPLSSAPDTARPGRLPRPATSSRPPRPPLVDRTATPGPRPDGRAHRHHPPTGRPTSHRAALPSAAHLVPSTVTPFEVAPSEVAPSEVAPAEVGPAESAPAELLGERPTRARRWSWPERPAEASGPRHRPAHLVAVPAPAEPAGRRGPRHRAGT